MGTATLPQLDPPDPEYDQPLPHGTLDPSPSFQAFHLPASCPQTSLRPPASAAPAYGAGRPRAAHQALSRAGTLTRPLRPRLPPCIMHLRPRPRANTEVATGRRARAAGPSRCKHLPFPRHSAHPSGSATEQPPRSSAAPKSKGVRLRHHNQMAEPPWPAAQPAHWTLPPPPPPPLAVARRLSAAIGSSCCRSSAKP